MVLTILLAIFSGIIRILSADNGCQKTSDAGLCLSCREDYYKQEPFNMNDIQGFDQIKCKPKTNLTYQREAFIYFKSPGDALNGSSGNLEKPYSNIIEAFAEETLKGDPFMFQNITFLLLKNENFILPSQMTPFEKFPFFRQMKANITLMPVYCDQDKFKVFCFANTGEKAIIYLKTTIFSFEVWGFITLANITLYGNDLNLIETDGCKNKPLLCCETIAMFQNPGACFIDVRSVSYKSEKRGFFNIYDLPQTNNYPRINMLGVSFKYFFPINDKGFQSIINIPYNSSFIILVNNCSFENNFLFDGILSQKNPNNDTINSSFNSSIKFKGVIVLDYNKLEISTDFLTSQ
jgi:hypothetical protein